MNAGLRRIVRIVGSAVYKNMAADGRGAMRVRFVPGRR